VRIAAVLLLALGPATNSPAQNADALRAQARAALAQTSGTLKLPGLKEPVEVLRDRWGIPHIYAENLDDLFFAQGVVVAQDRLFQIDLWRRIAVGETSTVAGPAGLDADRLARLLKYRGDLNAEWASYGPDARRIATAFTRGINTYIEHLGDRLPVEFQILKIRPAKWAPEDILGRMSGVIMTGNYRNELSRAALLAKVGPEMAWKLAPVDPPRDYVAVPGLDLQGLDDDAAAFLDRALKPVLLITDTDGSNNWAVSGSRSASQFPLQAGDPHRTLALPSLRYLVHLHAPGFHAAGSGEPALPGIALGHNEHCAWAFTIVGTDQADLFVEETDPQNPLRYKVEKGWETMQVVRETVRVRGGKDVEFELHFTRHGPVIHEDPARHRALALRWVGAEPGGAAYLGGLKLSRAKNWKEFRGALTSWKSPSENMMYADREGNIAWFAAGLTPVRKSGDGLLPVPGASGRYDWERFLKLDEHPQAFNPTSGALATANHNTLAKDFPRLISHEWSPPYRYEVIRSRLEGKEIHDLASFRSIQQENTTLPGKALVRLANELTDLTPEQEAARKVLANWDAVLTPECQAGPLYALWLRTLTKTLFAKHVAGPQLTFVRSRGVPVLLAALDRPTEFWFGPEPAQGRAEFLRKTFQEAVAETEKLFPRGRETWKWGQVHVARFKHPLADQQPVYAEVFNPAAVPRPGDGFTPNAASHNEQFVQTAGASYRQLFDLVDWDRGLVTSTPGQSGQPESPHYADLLPIWAAGDYIPLRFSRAMVEEVTQQRLTLQPAP